MPIKHWNYPSNWHEIKKAVAARAQGSCECTGQCGIHQPNPMPRRCCERHHTQARWFKGTVRLAMAHLCACNPPCGNTTHIIHACQRCHLRIDRFRHAAARINTQRLRRNHLTQPGLKCTQ